MVDMIDVVERGLGHHKGVSPARVRVRITAPRTLRAVILVSFMNAGHWVPCKSHLVHHIRFQNQFAQAINELLVALHMKMPPLKMPPVPCFLISPPPPLELATPARTDNHGPQN